MSAPLVSVLLLTRDAGPPFAAVLAAIARQKAPFPFEVVAIDSGSADGNLALLEGAGVRTIPVAPADFNHGATRNLGIASCRGDFVVMLVQDAEPDDDGRRSGPLRVA